MSQMDKEQKYTNDYFYPRTECNQYSVEKCHRWTKNRNTPMTIFIRGRSVISIPWKKSQMDQEQKLTNGSFYPMTECNQYSVEKCHRWTKNRNTPMTIFIRGRSIISIQWKMSQMDKEQKHTNDHFYPRTECNHYSVENDTDGQKTDTDQLLF